MWTRPGYVHSTTPPSVSATASGAPTCGTALPDCIRTLLGPVGRKNGWQLAEYTGHYTCDRLQLVHGATGEADIARDDLQIYVAGKLGETDGVVILDGAAAFVERTAPTAPRRTGTRHSGTAGRAVNCQIGVFPAHVRTRGGDLADREPQLPKSWTAGCAAKWGLQAPTRQKSGPREVRQGRVADLDESRRSHVGLGQKLDALQDRQQQAAHLLRTGVRCQVALPLRILHAGSQEVLYLLIRRTCAGGYV